MNEFSATTHLRVRYSETDQMGYVYYGNYAQYYEMGRVEALRTLGHTYKAMEESGVMMPVMHMECQYIKPARYDDLIAIKTTIRQLPSTRLRFEYEITNEAGVLLNKGETTLVFIDMKTNRPTRCPEFLMHALQEYLTE